MATHVARRFVGRGEPLDDLVQVAVVALIKAVDRFDPSRGVDFAGYAIPTIVGEIKRHFRDRTWTVRVPRRMQELRLRLQAATEELLQVLRRAPTTAELAERLGVSPGEVGSAQMCVNAYRPVTIERPVSGKPELRSDDWLGGLDPDMEAVDNRETLRVLLAGLPARERRILAMRFGAEMSQTQIAIEVGISQMHVSRLLTKCLAQLHDELFAEARPTDVVPRGGFPTVSGSAVPVPAAGS